MDDLGTWGYALDRLQSRWNALISSIILGLIWASWHIPLFFIDGSPQENMTMSLFYLSVLSATIVMTWLHNNSNANIFVALTYHSIGNSIIIIVDAESVGEEAMKGGELYNVLCLFVVALIVVFVWGPKTLTRSS